MIRITVYGRPCLIEYETGSPRSDGSCGCAGFPPIVKDWLLRGLDEQFTDAETYYRGTSVKVMYTFDSNLSIRSRLSVLLSADGTHDREYTSLFMGTTVVGASRAIGPIHTCRGSMNVRARIRLVSRAWTSATRLFTGSESNQ